MGAAGVENDASQILNPESGPESQKNKQTMPASPSMALVAQRPPASLGVLGQAKVCFFVLHFWGNFSFPGGQTWRNQNMEPCFKRQRKNQLIAFLPVHHRKKYQQFWNLPGTQEAKKVRTLQVWWKKTRKLKCDSRSLLRMGPKWADYFCITCFFCWWFNDNLSMDKVCPKPWGRSASSLHQFNRNPWEPINQRSDPPHKYVFWSQKLRLNIHTYIPHTFINITYRHAVIHFE